MPTEQRIVASKPKIGARPAPGGGATDREPAADEPTAKKSRKPILVVALVVLLLGAGAGYWFLLGPGAGTDAAAQAESEPPPELGEVHTVEAVSINLAGGHYLRLGLGLQLTADVHDAPDTARALDLAIALFSGRTVEEVSTTEGRTTLKAELVDQLAEAYEGEVVDVYFTDFVTQ